MRRRHSVHFSRDIKWDALDVNQPVTNVEVSFSNTCQLMCAYCYPSVSSMWEQAAPQYISFKPPVKNVSYRYKIDDIVDTSQLRSVQITGGEPLLDDECVKFLLSLPFDQTRYVGVITNLSYGNATLQGLYDILARHPTVHLMVSLDAVGENITRKYLNWTLWDRNFRSLVQDLQERRKTYPDVKIEVKSTVGMLNYDKLQTLIEYCLEFRKDGLQGVTFDLNPLAERELTSLRSGTIDSTKLISLSDDDYDILTDKEKRLVVSTNDLIRSATPDPHAVRRTAEFLAKYLT